MLYFTHMPESWPWTDLHQIWHMGSPRRRTVINYDKFGCNRYRGIHFVGPKFAISLFKELTELSMLLQCCRFRAACDDVIAVLSMKLGDSCQNCRKSCLVFEHLVQALSYLQPSIWRLHSWRRRLSFFFAFTVMFVDQSRCVGRHKPLAAETESGCSTSLLLYVIWAAW